MGGDHVTRSPPLAGQRRSRHCRDDALLDLRSSGV
jgi:hypothetical protein